MQALLCIPYVETILKELVMTLPPQCTTSDYPPLALLGRILAILQVILEVPFIFFMLFVANNSYIFLIMAQAM